jgi:hypothetical protein
MVGLLTAEGYLQGRPRFARSVGIASIMRHIFNTGYPGLPRMLFTDDCVAILHANFDHVQVTSTARLPGASFRLSPNIASGLGPSLHGEFMLTMATAAKVLVKNLECLRSYLEALIMDEDLEAGRPARNVHDLLAARSPLEDRVIRLAPPSVPSEPDVAEEWLSGIEELISDASDANKQPPEAIPWF